MSALKVRFALTAVALAPSVAVAAAPPRGGLLDYRWNSGYVVRESEDCICGRFVVRPGCSCLAPRPYRGYVDLTVLGDPARTPGSSWYLASPGALPSELAGEELPPSSSPPAAENPFRN